MEKALDLHQPTNARRPQFPTEEELEARRILNRNRASLLDDSWPAKVDAFRHLFSLSRFDLPQPGCLPSERNSLHERLLTEEFTETMDAAAACDLEETADGLLDLIYIALGWLCEMGFSSRQINLMMEEVHASNMTKVDDEGNPIYDSGGKVLKGHNYVKADVLAAAKIVERSSVS